MEIEINEELVNKRVLYKLNEHGAVGEGTIKEISPECNYIKIDERWYNIEKPFIVSVLSEIDMKIKEKYIKENCLYCGRAKGVELELLYCIPNEMLVKDTFNCPDWISKNECDSWKGDE